MRSVSVLEVEAVDPGLLGRCSWDVEQAQRDVDVLAWVGRFRFVTPQAIGERFGVSWQQANARVRRLERQRLLGCERQHVSQPRAVFLTGRGHELLGWPRRKPPRPHVHREHEEAIVLLVGRLEREHPDARVLTERECRRLESLHRERRFHVTLTGAAYRDRERWPDVVVETGRERVAYEIEFAPKGSDRLGGILAAYAFGPYGRVEFMVKNGALGRRIRRLIPPAPPSSLIARRDVRVVPWIGLASAEQADLAVKLAR